jgi:putative DNA primase/helicase
MTESAAEIARALCGRRNGSSFLCHCPVRTHGKGRGDRSPSLSIADGDKGLLVRCFAGCDPRDVLAAIRRMGFGGDGPPHGKPSWRRQSALEQKHEPEPEPRALELWRSAIPAHETLVEEYLRARGSTIPIPPSIRCVPYLDYMPRIGFPAMVAAIQAPERRTIAVQVTFLDPRGDRIAQVATPQKTIGALGRGAVRLGPAGEVLGLAEGVETALSAMQLFGIPIWASLGAGRTHNIAIPGGVRELRMFGDNDDPGRGAAKRIIRLNPHRKVIVHYPPEKVADWNDAVAAPRLALPS